MAALSMEWTILERLLLAQAVSKFGEDDWIQVARTLKQHPLLQCSTRLDTFNQKNCSLQYYLMLEDMETERRQPKTTSAIITQDMPNVIKLARQLYFQRVEELKKSIKKDEDQFMEILTEIDDIKSGAWDAKLLKETDDLVSSTTPTEPDNITSVGHQNTKDSAGESTMDNDMKPATGTISVQHETGVSQPINKVVDTAFTSDTEVQLRHTQFDDPVHGKGLNTSSTDTHETGMQIGIKRRTDDDEYPTEYLPEQQHTIDPSSKRLKLDTDKASNEDNGEPNDDASLDDRSIPTNTRSTSLSSNTTNYHDITRMISATSPSSKDTQTPSDTRPINTISTTGSLESRGNEKGNLAENESNRTTSGERRHDSDQRRNSWRENVNALWSAIANHKNSAMFMNPITEAQAPLYYKVVKHPMDLNTIKNRIREGTIRTTADFERDIMLMFTNSLMYNKEGTEMHQMTLEMLQDVTEQIKEFKTADDNGFTNTNTN